MCRRPVIAARHFAEWRTLADRKSANLRFFQNRDLPGMIELVLRNAVKHMIKIVPLAGHAVAEPGIRQPGHHLYQPVVRAFRLGNGLAPGRFRWLRYGREIVGACGLTFFSLEPDHTRVVPRRYVHHKLPYAVGARQWLGGSSCGIDVG